LDKQSSSTSPGPKEVQKLAAVNRFTVQVMKNWKQDGIGENEDYARS
jgi:hypothetical protein